MQFVANGPEIPDALLRAHEEGRVVFFCGAGISYPAGLPSFKGLVDAIYRIVGTTSDEIELTAYKRDQFDAVLDLLERRLPGQRLRVRAALANALEPKLRLKGATDTHAALLQLGHSRDGALRLVTTNFDRIFQRVAARSKQAISNYPAPLLPIPKNSRWNGLVYLHGLLPNRPDPSALNRLVLTSGDFGLAYLTERWAARFVSELFRNYIVCFVGYSINDPVLRYMMDALAADRMLGEVTPQAYALGECKPGRERAQTIEWEAKGVAPILYEVPTGTDNHSALHRTLKVWAEIYRDGILGKERIVVDYAITRPSASTQQDNFVGRMLWALSHNSGLPAKRFADFNPAPSLEWLVAFSTEQYRHSDLPRFGVEPRSEVDDRLRFSLIRRPAPYSRSSWMSLVSWGATNSQWDDVMVHLMRWLIRHLNDPELIHWVAQQGGQLHDGLAWQIEHELDRFVRLESEGKTVELEEIRTNSPNAIPEPLMRVCWRLLLAGRVKSPSHDLDLYRWKDRLKRDGVTTTLRMELRELLAPKITLKKPIQWSDSETEAGAAKHLKQLVDWELVLAADHVQSSIMELADFEQWRKSLPILLNDIQQLLRDALDLLSELGAAGGTNDLSYWDLPSISPHWQNRHFRDWVALIVMLRDAWLAVHDIDTIRATQLAREWFSFPQPTFKRLALFAASHDGCIASDQWVDWLTTEDAQWLWAVDTKRETMRLLVLQGAHLTSDARERLETAILAGPPRSMYKDNIEPEYWVQLVDHSVWLHLSKLRESGSDIGASAAQRLHDLSTANPEWKLVGNERDEFSHWMSGTGDPDYESNRVTNWAPRKRTDLVAWLKLSPSSPLPFSEDNWRSTCSKHLLNCSFALIDLAKEGKWPTDRWCDAIQAWSEKGRIRRSWQLFAPFVQSMPYELLLENSHGVTWWIEAASKSMESHESIFLDLCRRILSLQHQDSFATDNPVTKAINHPVGHITQALLNIWLKRKPNDNDKLPPELEPLFTQLCDTQVGQFRHGRVLLASRLIALFRVDSQWTVAHLLPLLDWKANPIEARAVWEGFLWSPRLYGPLLIAFKTQFLETAHHYSQLGEHGRNFTAFLTYAALDPIDNYTQQDFKGAIGALPTKGLQESAQALVQALEGAGEQREENWKNRIHPFWQQVWPKSRQLATVGIAEPLARLAIAARKEFPSALLAVLDWLQPIEHLHHVVRLLHDSDISSEFPEDALRLLNAIVNNQVWAPQELAQCLNAISLTSPVLKNDNRFQRLTDYARRRGLLMGTQ